MYVRHTVYVSHNDDTKGNMGFIDVTLAYDDDAKVEGKTLVTEGKTLVTEGKTLQGHSWYWGCNISL